MAKEESPKGYNPNMTYEIRRYRQGERQVEAWLPLRKDPKSPPLFFALAQLPLDPMRKVNICAQLLVPEKGGLEDAFRIWDATIDAVKDEVIIEGRRPKILVPTVMPPKNLRGGPVESK